MKKLGKSLLVFILSRIISLIYIPLFNFRHYRNRKNAIRQFVLDNNPTLNQTTSEFTKTSLHYYRKFKHLNMLLLLSGIYLDDVEIFYKSLGDAEIQGIEILEKFKEQSAIGISYHMGPFSMIPVILAMHGYNTSLLVRSDTLYKHTKMSIDKINEAMDLFALNHNWGNVRFIDSLSTFSLILIRKRLKEGEMLIIYPDTAKESSVSSLPVNFFNTQIAGHIGVAKLCRFTRATVIPLSIRWRDDNNIRLKIDEPLDVNPDGTDEEIVNIIYGPFEKRVASCPEQWTQVESYEKFKY